MKPSFERVWIVVAVERGIPVLVRGFRGKSKADVLAAKLRRDSNPENDEVQVFEVPIRRHR